jgi:hypothetical protein
VLARRVTTIRERLFAPLRNRALRTCRSFPRRNVDRAGICGLKQPVTRAARRVQLHAGMRNIATLVSGSLIGVASLLAASSALAEPCEKDEEHHDAECQEYETYMMPGGQATLYKPTGVEKPYIGGGFRLDVVRWSHHNGDFGPGEGSVFFQASLLQSPSSKHTLGIYEGGMTLSFEKNPKRRFMIPYFGFTTGGMFADDLPKTGFVQPLAGIHLYAHPNVVADLQGGYVFPTDEVDRLHGFRAQASIRVHAW